jgi:hypothetical protein
MASSWPVSATAPTVRSLSDLLLRRFVATARWRTVGAYASRGNSDFECFSSVTSNIALARGALGERRWLPDDAGWQGSPNYRSRLINEFFEMGSLDGDLALKGIRRFYGERSTTAARTAGWTRSLKMEKYPIPAEIRGPTGNTGYQLPARRGSSLQCHRDRSVARVAEGRKASGTRRSDRRIGWD